MSEPTLAQVLARSDELDHAVWSALPDPYRPAISSPRHDASLAAAMVALEHGRACRLLFSQGMHTTGIAFTRIQFEALCLSMWLLYAATDKNVAVATADLSVEVAKDANDLPMASKMIDGGCGQKLRLVFAANPQSLGGVHGTGSSPPVAPLSRSTPTKSFRALLY